MIYDAYDLSLKRRHEFWPHKFTTYPQAAQLVHHLSTRWRYVTFDIDILINLDIGPSAIFLPSHSSSAATIQWFETTTLLTDIRLDRKSYDVLLKSFFSVKTRTNVALDLAGLADYVYLLCHCRKHAFIKKRLLVRTTRKSRSAVSIEGTVVQSHLPPFRNLGNFVHLTLPVSF